METGLFEAIDQYVAKEKEAVRELAGTVDKTTQTIKRWLRKRRIPGIHNRYLIARHIGRSEDEAVSLAHERPRLDATEPAQRLVKRPA